jgi:hypothetical protein
VYDVTVTKEVSQPLSPTFWYSRPKKTHVGVLDQLVLGGWTSQYWKYMGSIVLDRTTWVRLAVGIADKT